MYKAVVFDFEGTVIDTEKHLFDLINTHLKIHQEAPISLEFYKQFIGGETTGLHTYLEDAIGFKNKEKIYDQYYQTIIQLPVNPTIIQLMQYLKKRHIPMAIATSSYKKNIYPIFKQLGLTADELQAWDSLYEYDKIPNNTKVIEKGEPLFVRLDMEEEVNYIKEQMKGK